MKLTQQAGEYWFVTQIVDLDKSALFFENCIENNKSIK